MKNKFRDFVLTVIVSALLGAAITTTVAINEQGKINKEKEKFRTEIIEKTDEIFGLNNTIGKMQADLR